MIALVDCNSFFCSVEKVFHPGLHGQPVCVLSNNDGCIVALTPEAKALGLHRGDPLFQVQHLIDTHHVHLFSTNMTLYAAMSQRITHILRQHIAHVENYSIDESFCYLNGYAPHFQPEAYMRQLAQTIQRYTDIPVSVGIAPTKTLAKMGSKFAKQHPGYHSVCTIDTDAKRRKALQLFPLADVWGIGTHTLQKLQYYGIHTPLQFADKSPSWVNTHLHKPGRQTWLELNGTPCIDTPELLRNQSLCTSRSFGQPITALSHLKASVATFASSCANKLRAQHSGTTAVTTFLSSNRFQPGYYANAATQLLTTPTADTLEITQAALRALSQIYLPDIAYKKSGVIVSQLTNLHAVQTHLFDPIANRGARQQLMTTIDQLNQRYGPKTIHLGIEGHGPQPWQVKCAFRSPNYLTDLRDILTIHC